MRYSLAGTVVKSCRNGINSCSSSNELGAQYVWPHQTTIKRKSHQTCKHEPALPVVMDVASWSCSGEKNCASGCSEQLHVERAAIGEVSGDDKNGGTSWKTVQNSKANCCTLLKRTTKLKCVNSEVKSVHSHPQRGLPQLALLSPCRRHHRNHTRQERIFEKIRQELSPCKPA